MITLLTLDRVVMHESESHLVVSDSLRPHGRDSPWNSPGQNTGVGSRSLHQGIFPTQGLNPGLLHCWRTLYQLSQIPGPTQTNAAQEAIPWKDTEPADRKGGCRSTQDSAPCWDRSILGSSRPVFIEGGVPGEVKIWGMGGH